jgi:hypothetical protein
MQNIGSDVKALNKKEGLVSRLYDTNKPYGIQGIPLALFAL